MMTFNQFLIAYSKEQFGFVPRVFSDDIIRAAKAAFNARH